MKNIYINKQEWFSVFFLNTFYGEWPVKGSCPLVLFLRFVFGLSDEYENAQAKSLETSIPLGHFSRMTVTRHSLFIFCCFVGEEDGKWDILS